MKSAAFSGDGSAEESENIEGMRFIMSRICRRKIARAHGPGEQKVTTGEKLIRPPFVVA